MLWRLQYRGHEEENGLPEKEAHPPVTQPWGDQGGGGGFLRVLGISIGAVTTSRTQAAPVVLVGGH